MNIDYLPGYLKDRKGNDRGGLRAMFIGGDAALYKGSHVTMFEYLAAEDSSSLTFEFTVWDGVHTAKYQKPVVLTRKFADGQEYDSVMEFYHLFSREEIDPSGEYVVELWGTDMNGEQVEGTKETFVIKHAPAESISVEERS